jgi:two-component system, NtrC family, sensor kinase
MTDHIIIVDDSLTVRMDLGDAFHEAGFDCSLCTSADEARSAIRRKSPSLVVLDVHLVDSDGIELLAELRRSQETSATPVILLSSEAEVKDRVRGLETGASAYIGKPYDRSYVVARARNLLLKEKASDGPPRVLVIDDSITFREVLGTFLRELGYDVVLASSGEEGLRRAADVRPDAIVVDGVMPDLDGTAVIRRIRLDSGLQTIPCLLLTASEEGASEILALDSGADAYVRKGDGNDIVAARLQAMLRVTEESRERDYAPSLLAPKRVLAVDDSVTYLEELSAQLSSDGYEIIKARSGKEALALLAVEQVDAILLDLLMPDLSGTETCKQIKASPGLRNVPLIMLTALAEAHAMIEGINAGADDYVAKTGDFDVLKARLRAQVRRKQFEDENRRIREDVLRKGAEAQAAQQLAEARAMLLQELERKNAELQAVNRELQAFAYSVSHDLRQPLRGMDGFSKVVLEQYGDRLDDTARHYLERVRASAQRMEQLIDGLLVLSRVHAKEIQRGTVSLDAIAWRVIDRLKEGDPSRRVDCVVADSLTADADEHLMESVFENLLGNAWKFTSRCDRARIEVGVEREKERDGNRSVYSIVDNGVGFKMDYVDKLFGPFQRLHSDHDFPGTGIGLATVQRIVHRHGGEIWARSEPDVRTAFFFTLGPRPEESIA